jgi:hypothetical protein
LISSKLLLGLVHHEVKLNQNIHFFKPQAPVHPTAPGPVDLTGKTTTTTGGNQGLGFETAYQLLAL